MTQPVEIERLPLIGDIMSRPVLTVEVRESLWDAWQLLFVSGHRHLVVLNDDGSAVGVISDRNILADIPATAEHLSKRQVAEVMAQVPLVFVAPSESPTHAAQVMSANMVEALPVLDADGRLAGIVTESDIVRWCAGSRP